MIYSSEGMTNERKQTRTRKRNRRLYMGTERHPNLSNPPNREYAVAERASLAPIAGERIDIAERASLKIPYKI